MLPWSTNKGIVRSDESYRSSSGPGGRVSERTPFIVGNWKMFKTIPQTREALLLEQQNRTR